MIKQALVGLEECANTILAEISILLEAVKDAASKEEDVKSSYTETNDPKKNYKYP